MAERPKHRPTVISADHFGTAQKERSRYPDAAPPTRPATLSKSTESAPPAPTSAPAKKRVRARFANDLDEFLAGIDAEIAKLEREERADQVRRNALSRRQQSKF